MALGNELKKLIEDKIALILKEVSEEKLMDLMKGEIAKLFDVRYYDASGTVSRVLNKTIDLMAQRYVDENFNEIVKQIDQKLILNLVTSKFATSVVERMK